MIVRPQLIASPIVIGTLITGATKPFTQSVNMAGERGASASVGRSSILEREPSVRWEIGKLDKITRRGTVEVL